MQRQNQTLNKRRDESQLGGLAASATAGVFVARAFLRAEPGFIPAFTRFATAY